MKRIEQRIIKALRDTDKYGMTIADELVVSRETATFWLSRMAKQGMIYKRFSHNRKKNCPDYIYSLVPKQPIEVTNGSLTAELVGAFDIIDFTKVKQ